MSIICLGCKEIGHEPLSCGELEDWQKRIEEIGEEVEFVLWKKQNTKKCPKCKVDIEKNRGCMHMHCSQCDHHFCWLCLGDWDKHGDHTGGYYQCNMYDPEAVKEDMDDDYQEEINRIKFFLNRFNEHKASLEVVSEELKKLLKNLHPFSGSKVSRFNNEAYPGELDFYKEIYAYLLLCRSFLVNMYPISYKLGNSSMGLLFSQNQYFLEYTVEKLHKYIEDNPIEKFVNEVNGKLYHDEDFEEMQYDLEEMYTKLKMQFKGAQKTYSNPNFLKKVNKTWRKEIMKQKEEAKKDLKIWNYTDWNCIHCTFWNEDNTEDICTMCEMDGRPNYARIDYNR